ncbi:MAG: CHAT domain-containing protein, partial [Bacteroidales bacterium]|nr:CHAT domain-containing protein [Bacteroidales bacterium]
KEYSITYAYSSQFILLSRNEIKKRKVKDILAFEYSNPDINDHRNKNQNKDTFLSLKGSKTEIATISKLVKGNIYYADQATETNFKTQSSDYDLLHLAIHGKSDPVKPQQSCLYFNKSGDSLNDGTLYPYELYNRPLKAELAVLSACETGSGKIQTSEGILSIGWGFTYVGCKSVIVSLWKANDQSTSKLMQYFYKGLFKHQGIHEAIQKSKIQFLNEADEYTAHPSNWAAFILFGNTEPLTLPQKKLWWFTIISILGILVVFFKINGIRK